MGHFAGFVHVDFSEALGRNVEMISDFFNVGFGEEETLWATEASESGVGDSVGFGKSTSDVDVGDHVDAVGVRECSVDHGGTEILGPTGIGEDISIEGLELAIIVDTDFPSVHESVALSRSRDIFITVEHASHRSSRLLCGSGNDAGKLNRSSLFAAKATSQSLDFADDLVGGYTAHLSDIGLTSGMLIMFGRK